MKPRYVPALLPTRPFRIVFEGYEPLRGLSMEFGTIIVIIMLALYIGYHITDDYYAREEQEAEPDAVL